MPSWPFWSNKNLRPKLSYQGVLLFSDLIFGGTQEAPLPSFLIKSFSRPGYSAIETAKGEYQLKTGDFAQIFYPTQGYTTKDISVEIVDVALSGDDGLPSMDVAAHIYNALTIMGKTWTYEQQAIISSEGQRMPGVINNITTYMRGNPPFITMLELDNSGKAAGTWRVHNPLLTSVDFSDISYERDEITTISLKFQYKNFEFNQRWGSGDLAAKWNAARRASAYDINNIGGCDSPPQTGQDIDHSRKRMSTVTLSDNL